jgi:hypothetical protein
MNRFPDNPQRISPAMLARLDADPPGTWLAQPKLDGWRCVCWAPSDGSPTWTYASKYGGGPRAKTPPKALTDAFERFPWPAGVAFDTEWTGPRRAGAADRLWLFDVLALGGQWLTGMPFSERWALLEDIWGQMAQQVWPNPCLVDAVLTWPNPGLVDRFEEQLQDPLSEGLVLRRHDAKAIGAEAGPAENPLMLKVKLR